MVDVHGSVIRSKNMAAIKGYNTKPELIVRKALHKQGYRYTLQNKQLPGKPDIVLPKYNAVIFVHGCFWHHHACHLFKWPMTRKEFWIQKLNGIVLNDRIKQETLQRRGWRVGIIWECALKGKTRISLDILTASITSWLKSNNTFIEIHGNIT